MREPLARFPHPPFNGITVPGDGERHPHHRGGTGQDLLGYGYDQHLNLGSRRPGVLDLWTKGLDPWRIAVLCRVPYRKVYDHIRTRITYHPELFGQRLMVHDQPAVPPGGLKKPKPTWEERAADLVDFRQVYGRFPRGYLEGESSLYSFLQSQRGRYRAGKLLEARKSFLDENLSGWLTPPKAERERSLWEQRLSELGMFVQENRRLPRYKSAVSSSEKVLAVWISHQRHQTRIGKLTISREKKLNEVSPGWK